MLRFLEIIKQQTQLKPERYSKTYEDTISTIILTPRCPPGPIFDNHTYS